MNARSPLVFINPEHLCVEALGPRGPISASWEVITNRCGPLMDLADAFDLRFALWAAWRPALTFNHALILLPRRIEQRVDGCVGPYVEFKNGHWRGICSLRAAVDGYAKQHSAGQWCLLGQQEICWKHRQIQHIVSYETGHSLTDAYVNLECVLLSLTNDVG